MNQNPNNEDVPLKVAMIVWNDPPPHGDGRILVARHLEKSRKANELSKSTGACWAAWQGDLSSLKYKLLREIWMIARQGIKPEAIHEACWVIPEYREMCDESLFDESNSVSLPRANL